VQSLQKEFEFPIFLNAEDDQATTRTFIPVVVLNSLKRYLELRIVESTILAVWRFARLTTAEVA
jgi:hypothetical protein